MRRPRLMFDKDDNVALPDVPTMRPSLAEAAATERIRSQHFIVRKDGRPDASACALTRREYDLLQALVAANQETAA